jgi:hypothetical protein
MLSLTARRFRPLTVFTVLAMLPAGLDAQVNIERLRIDDPPLGVSGSLSSNLTVQTGNTDFVQVALSGRIYNVTEAVTTLMVGNGGIGFVGRNRFASSGLFHYRRTFAVSAWLSPEWYGQANYDRSQNLTFRLVGGGGVRAPVAEGSWGQLAAGTALMLEHERLALPDTAVHARRTTTVRSSTSLSFRVVPSDQLVVTSTTYLQPQVGDPGDLRMLENFALAAPVSDRLSLTVSFNLRYDSRPPDGLATLDTRLMTGVTLIY